MSGLPAMSLEDFAQEIFPIFGIADFEERFSSHYIDDHYYVGQRENLKVKVMLTDDEEHEDLPFWIQLERIDLGSEPETDFVEPLVKDELLPRGYSVARIEKFGLKDEERINY